MAEWQLKVPAGVVPRNLPVYIALGLVAVLLLVMLLTGSGAPSDESAAGGEQAIEAAVADVSSVVEPVLREGERLREDLARLGGPAPGGRGGQKPAGGRGAKRGPRGCAPRARGAPGPPLLQAQRIRDEAESRGLPPRGGVRRHPGGARDGRGAGASGGDPAAGGRALCAVAPRAGRRGRSRRGRPLLRGAAPPPPVITGDPLLDEQLLALLRQEAAAGAPGQVPSPPPPRAGAPEVVPVGPAADAVDRRAAAPTEFYAVGPDVDVPESSGGGSVAVARWPAVPEGLDLVYEGRMMQAVLETALTGDFTGPARARLTLPVRTADRRRVVIPRGTVALGDAQAVDSGFQTRLAVRFSRLRFPDGRSVRMGFEGLSSIGETGLTDEVNRHYRSTLGAVGAVGLLAGLSAGGGGSQGYFDPARQQFSVAAMRFLDRFMNRLPEVRVRAGHPVRIYLTQDLLVPRV